MLPNAKEVRYSSLAKQLGFSDPKPGKTMDDLAITRFPAEQGKTYNAVTKEKVPTWTPYEIWNALWPSIYKLAKQFSSGAWSPSKSGTDRDEFENNVQNISASVLAAIQSGEDRGDAFLPWIKTRMKGQARNGVGGDLSDAAASGYLGKLARMSKPEQVEELFSTIDPQDIEKPRRRSEGNKYGESTPELAEITKEYMEVLGIEDKNERMAALKDIRERIVELQNEYRLDRSVVQGPSTGSQDFLKLPHSDSPNSQYLSRLLKTTDAAEAANISKRRVDEPSLEVGRNYIEALESGDEMAIYNAKREIEAKLHDLGNRNNFRQKHKRAGLTVPGADGDGEVDNPRMKSHIDPDISTGELTSEVVQEILEMAIDGVKVGNQIIKFDTRELRTLIRLFGIEEYPTKGTPEDIEFDTAKYTEALKELQKTIGGSYGSDGGSSSDEADRIMAAIDDASKGKDGKKDIQKVLQLVQKLNELKYESTVPPYQFHVVSLEELRWAMRRIADEAETLDDETERLETIQIVWKESKTVPVIASNEEMAEEFAKKVGYSVWVRKGCPKFSTNQLRDELFKGSKKYTDIINRAIGSASREKEDDDDPRPNPQKIITFDWDSKLGKIVKQMDLGDKLDMLNTSYLPLDKEKIDLARAKNSDEEVTESINTIARSALAKVCYIVETAFMKSILTESRDKIMAIDAVRRNIVKLFMVGIV